MQPSSHSPHSHPHSFHNRTHQQTSQQIQLLLIFIHTTGIGCMLDSGVSSSCMLSLLLAPPASCKWSSSMESFWSVSGSAWASGSLALESSSSEGVYKFHNYGGPRQYRLSTTTWWILPMFGPWRSQNSLLQLQGTTSTIATFIIALLIVVWLIYIYIYIQNCELHKLTGIMPLTRIWSPSCPL
jgi:hypothetical protein